MSTYQGSLLQDKMYHFNGELAVDGIYEDHSVPASIAASEAERSPWIQIDLEDTYCIEGVQLWHPAYYYGEYCSLFFYNK